MSRLNLAAALLAWLAPISYGQQVPGRDLLDFQIGTLGEAPALAHLSGDGLWNPASVALPRGTRARLAASTLHTPSEQAVSAQLISAGVQFADETTASLTVVRAQVDGIVRTDTDPQTIAGDVPYSTTVVSATAARRHEQFVIALAARYRIGQLDDQRQSAFGLDGGVIINDLIGGRARLGASTFLWQPGGGDEANAVSYQLAGDVRVAGADSLREARAGYGLVLGAHSASEHFLYGAGRYGPFEARAGLARLAAYGHADWRLRVGLGLHHARYTVGIAREENGASLAPVYQFTLSAVVL